ncbi:MAG TPA: aldehyde dehydrogenase family protein [Pseudothermotoga sp.]
MKMLIAGHWIDRPQKIEILYPYDETVVDTVPMATEEDIESALSAAVEGAKLMKKLPAWKRSEILQRTSEILTQRKEEMTKILVKEVGKTFKEAAAEVIRTAEIFKYTAEEAKRIHGETLSFDSSKGSQEKIGYFIREPAGVVLAIVPFNVPLALCAHKVAPAIAAGNAVIVKPASKTPLNTLLLGEILLDAGMPPEALSIITGSGNQVGLKLVEDKRVRVVSFTGSVPVGELITKAAGIKKLCLELGSNSPMIVCKSADLFRAAKATISGGFSIAGQVCISVQRVYVQRDIYQEFIDILLDEVKKMNVGDPELETTHMGPVIDRPNANRIIEWIDEAIKAGGKILIGGGREKNLIEPTILAQVPKNTKIMTDELFGPAVAVNSFETFDQAIEEANSTRYGLQAGVFTKDIQEALRAIKELDFGGVMINEGPRFRADLMPYGGYKDSGIGREGIRFAIEEMTEIKTVAFDFS